MDTQKFCQSCSMPLDNKEMLGTEKMVRRVQSIVNTVI